MPLRGGEHQVARRRLTGGEIFSFEVEEGIFVLKMAKNVKKSGCFVNFTFFLLSYYVEGFLVLRLPCQPEARLPSPQKTKWYTDGQQRINFFDKTTDNCKNIPIFAQKIS